MKVAYTVHSTHDTEVSVEATTADGRKVQAKVPGLVIELVPDQPGFPVISLPLQTDGTAGHHDALEDFGIGAKVALVLKPELPGKTPHQVKTEAAAQHLADAEKALADAEAAKAPAEQTAVLSQAVSDLKATLERHQAHAARIAQRRADLAAAAQPAKE